MKTYVLMLSKVFPATHPLKGEPTGFREAFRKNKLHTIRANYPLWKKRIAEVQRGEAVLSVRQWSGRPYMSKQVELARLTREDGIGLQELRFDKSRFLPNVNYKPVGVGRLANNDGLSLEDWKEWFKNYDITKPLAIIHFTNFRY